MTRYIFVAALLPLVLCAAARADDAKDCNRAMKAPDDAIRGCTRLLDSASDADAWKILLLRSQAYVAKKQFEEALADAERMAKLAPNPRSPIMARGFVHDAMKDYDAAIADYSELLARNPNDYIALSNRCSVRSRSNRDPKEALADCDAAIALFGRPGPDLMTRGFVYLRLGRNKEALADYDLAVATSSSYAHAYYGRGIAKIRLGDAEAGKADIAQAVAKQNDVADSFAPYGLTP